MPTSCESTIRLQYYMNNLVPEQGAPDTNKNGTCPSNIAILVKERKSPFFFVSSLATVVWAMSNYSGFWDFRLDSVFVYHGCGAVRACLRW